MHVGELGEPLRQLDRLGLGEAVVVGVYKEPSARVPFVL